MKRPLITVMVALALGACSGGGTQVPGGGGMGGAGATGPGGGAGAGGDTCGATRAPNTILANFTGYSLSVVGQDAYYVDPAANAERGAIRHVMLDGTGDAPILYSPTGIIFGVTAIGPNLFYFLSDDAHEVHMFQSPRATGGAGTQVGTGTFDGFSKNILGGGYAGIRTTQPWGVFAQSGTDVFVNDGVEISRVSTVSGTQTVIATVGVVAGEFLSPALVGDTVFFKDDFGVIYSVAADATAPGATRFGTAVCGLDQWMSIYAGGFLCGESFGIDKIDATATMKSHVIYTAMDQNIRRFNPSQVDGTTFYALPNDLLTLSTIYELDVSGTALTPLVCAVGQVIDYKLTATDLVYVEVSFEGGIELKRVAR